MIPRSKCFNLLHDDVAQRIVVALTTIAFSSFMIPIEPSIGMDEYFILRQQAKDPLKAKAVKELRELKTLQDSRLDACVGTFHK
jgi:hypothetical protein